jgi:hypothetical protein
MPIAVYMAVHAFMRNCARRVFVVRRNEWRASCENKDLLRSVHPIAQLPRHP